MPVSVEKRVHTLKIDKGFQELIRPLYKNEYLQLEENLIADGCRDPITVWNGVIVDGHNRYNICKKHDIPFAIEEKSFSCREEAIVWICANQLGRRNLTEESRKYLIGKQYESQKIVTRKRAFYRDSTGSSPDLPYETFDPNAPVKGVETKKKTATQIGEEHHISHGTVEKYSIYARALEEIRKKEPEMVRKILSGRYKISHNSVLELAKRSAEDIKTLNRRLEKNQEPFTKYQTTRLEIQGTSRNPGNKRQPSIKDMPDYDPDAEVIGLALTIPSWDSSIKRINNTNLRIVSDAARSQLRNALLDLQKSIITIIEAIKEDR